MTIKKILIVPSKRLQINYVELIKNRVYRQELPHHAEIQYAGDLPSVLGPDNVFVIGQYYPSVFAANFPLSCPYPSCHGATRPTFIKRKQIDKTLRQVDAVIISAIGEPDLIAQVIKRARRFNLPVAILDIPDYDTLYGDPDIYEHLTLDFKVRRDYDIYFKKDLPKGFGTDLILPFGPIPVRPSSYHFIEKQKTKSVFYNGRKREDQSSPERAQIVEAVQEKIPDTNIMTHDDRSTFITNRQYWDFLSQARVALSPSGRCWDSFRHCEVGLAPNVAIMLPKPFIETCGPPIRDGHNAIVYDVVLRDRRYYLADANVTLQKLKNYLQKPEELERLAKNWRQDVLSGHTVEARSRYLINMMREKL